MSLQFELPASLKAEKFIAKLIKLADIELTDKRYCLRTYYDSFDWRLWANGMLCEFDRSKTSSVLTLRTYANGRIIADSEMAEIPAFPKQFLPGKIRGALQSVLEMRALLAVCTIEYEAYHLNVMNKDKKTILRLIIEDYEICKSRLLLQTIKGYEQKTEGLIDLLIDDLGLIATDKPVLLTALQLQGRQPKDYSAKLKFDFDPSLRAVMAVKIIYSRLLKTIKANEQGTLADTDSEFLHDYRVAVRRTRAGLNRLKGVLPDDIAAYYADFFSWLGQVTGPTRDLDVYLSGFERYKECLPPAIRDDLNPFFDFLLEAKYKARQNLAHQLKSPRYIKTLLDWEQYLKQHPPLNAAEPNANLTIKEFADSRIWKVYNRVLQEGKALTPDSPAESLHSLRKTCKKLRYLMEFFQHLYPAHKIKRLLKDLKALQDVLGDFQDFDVQERRIKGFSEEMMQNNIPAKTLLAMGVLIQALDVNKDNARKHFSSRFERFAQEKNHSAFKSLFAGED
jgi:CHAD domain-containing protein